MLQRLVVVKVKEFCKNPFVIVGAILLSIRLCVSDLVPNILQSHYRLILMAVSSGVNARTSRGSKQDKNLTIVGACAHLSAVSVSKKLGTNCAICAIIVQFL